MAVFTGITAVAQDTTRHKEVSITSTFKPTLKEATKININPTPPTPDTSRPVLQYNIPNQNLLFAFQPGSLKPLALTIDTARGWGNDSYIKVGFGNYKTPFIQAGISVGDGSTMGLNVYAKHFSSQGKIAYQNVMHTNIDVNAFLQTAKNLEWNARFGGVQERYNKYGFEPKNLQFPEDSLKLKYQTWRGRVSVHNINRTALGISYSPEMKIDVFTDQLNTSDNNLYFNVPVQKSLGDAFEAAVAIEGNLATYKRNGKSSVNNRYFSLAPSIAYKTAPVHILAGIKPTWNNGNFTVLPEVMAVFSSRDDRFSFQAGWVAHMRYAGAQFLTNQNPWIWMPDSTFNSKIDERYAGFKGAAGNHFNYSAKVAYNLVQNQPLYINDDESGKSFAVLHEPEMKVFNFGGSLGYTVGEKFSVVSSLEFNKYTTSLNEKAWGLLPLEFYTTVKVQVLKDLYVNTSLFAFDGAWAHTSAGNKKMGGAMDLSAGLEFKIIDRVKIWGQFNNILNSTYQRWNQYPVYGFNLLAGVVFSFAQNK